VRKDGALIDVEVHGMAMELGGKPALTGILTDVTESRRAQRRIEESEAKLKAIFDAATDGIAVADPTTLRLDSANNAFCKMLGYSPEEIVGLRVVDLHPENSAQDVLADFDLQSKGLSKGSKDVVMKRNDGEVFFADISTTFTKVGDEFRVVGVFHDVTERKRNEESLRKANRALKTLSAGNEALVHATNEAGLLTAMCRTIIQTGGYDTAWVGYARPDPGKSVELMASDGREAQMLRQIRMSWGDGPYGEGVTGSAIRVGEKQLLRGLKTNPRVAAWRDLMDNSDAKAALGLPLRANGGPPFGALTILAQDDDAFDEEECELLEELARDLSFGIIGLRTRDERSAAAEKLREGLEDSIQAIATTVEMRDPYTGGHERRVAQLAEAIAAEMGLDSNRIHGLHLAGIVHDLGKIGVPAEILSKPGRLSELELELVKTHPQNGYDILKNVDFPWPIAQMVLQHHERLDGSGYPQGLKGDQILLESRILTVADVVEAMSSHRPYRAGLGTEIALHEIEDKRGRWFDPDAVDACVRLFREKGFGFDA
jgi:PAS domain S-box-containing protein